MGRRGRRSAVAAAAAAAALAGAVAARSCSAPSPGDDEARAEALRHPAPAPSSARAWPGGAGQPASGEADAALAPAGREAATAAPDALATGHLADALLAPGAPPSAGWEEAAEVVASDLRRLAEGEPRAGAYAEARAEAARADLALFPPERAQVRRLLGGSERERILALAALAARPDLDDDLLRLVLRSQRRDDADVVRLLGAEIAAAAPADLAARHEDDLLRAFAREPNPLVLAVALPALERMEEGRLRALLRAQAAAAPAEMLPVLLALARDRLGAAAVEDVRAALAAAVGLAR